MFDGERHRGIFEKKVRMELVDFVFTNTVMSDGFD